MLALGLALSSSLCWGVADFIGGVQTRAVPLLRVMLISQAVGLAGLVVALAIRGSGPPSLSAMLPAAAAGLAGIVALAGFYRALAIGTMSIVSPIAATGVAVPVVVGIAGGEHPQAAQLAGIVLAVLGVILASREADLEPHARRAARTTIGLALIAALGFGTFFVALRASARHDVLWALFASRVFGVLAIAGATLYSRPPWARSQPHRAQPHHRGGAFLPLALMGGLDLGANALYALATRRGLLSIVSVAASLYPLVTVLLARAVLGERVQRVQEAGILAALAGVVLIAAA